MQTFLFADRQNTHNANVYEALSADALKMSVHKGSKNWNNLIEQMSTGHEKYWTWAGNSPSQTGAK